MTLPRWIPISLALLAGCSGSSDKGSSPGPQAPGAPTAVQATADVRSALVTWTAATGSGITGYTVRSTPDDVAARTTGSTSAVVTGLRSGVPYTFSVFATNAQGNGPAASSAAITTPDVPGLARTVTATAGVQAAGIDWAAPSSDGGRPITGYVITVAPGGVTLDVGVQTHADVASLGNGTAYTLSVAARNAVGVGPAAAAPAVTTVDVPGAPATVSAVAGDGFADVSWTAPLLDGGSPIVGYRVTPSPAGTAVETAGTTATLTGLTNGVPYQFTVVALNAAGAGSASAPSLAATPRGAPSAPTGVVATAGVRSASVTWIPGASGGSPILDYSLVASPSGITTVVTGTSATVAGLADATSYTFVVTARNALGQSPPSGSSAPVVTLTAPGAPTGVSATAGIRSAAVSWTAPAATGGAAISGYTVTASPGGATATATGTSATVSGLANGTSYTFTVVATNVAGDGPASVASAAVTTPDLPGAPRSVVATPGNGSASVTWQAPAADGGRAVTGYVVTVAPGGATVNATTAPATVPGLTNGTAYTLSVAAVNAVGTGAVASAAPVTPFDPNVTALAIVAGDAQSTAPLEPFALDVRVVARNAAGVAVPGVTVAAEPAEGLAVSTVSAVTNGSGEVAWTVRAGRAAGPTAVTFRVGPAQVTASLTVTAPAAGVIEAVVNAGRATVSTGAPPASRGVPGAATAMAPVNPRALAVASDGTLYVGDEFHVYRVSPAGAIALVAGSGSCCTLGDGGPAVDGYLRPSSLALDQANGVLYVADQGSRIRAIDLATGLISTYAGGGTPATGNGDGGPATSASLGGTDSIQLGPDGALYINQGTWYGTGRGIRRVDPVTGVITTWLASGTGLLAIVGSGNIVWDGAGNAFLVTNWSFGNGGIPYVVRRAPDGTVTLVAGSSGGGTGDGVAATTARFTGDLRLAMDPAGNLLVSDAGGHRVRFIEGGSSRITTLAGNGAAASAGDAGAATASSVNGPAALAFDAAGNLYVAERDGNAVRVIWGVARSTPEPAILAEFAGTTQTTTLGDVPAQAIAARLTDGGGAALAGFTVKLSSLDPGGHLYASECTTSANGVCGANVRAGLAVGTYRFRASFQDAHGAPVLGSPVEFTITASAPAAGTILTAVNVGRISGSAGVPGAATMAQTVGPRALAMASDGTLYVGEGSHVYRVSPAGAITLVAGSGSCCTFGDGGPAIDAYVSPSSLALDEANGVLYVADSATRIRAIDLVTGLISTCAGGGAPATGNGDGGAATSASLGGADSIQLGPDGALYINQGTWYGSGRGIRRVDPVTGVITTWLASGTGLLGIVGAGNIVWDGAGNAFLGTNWSFGNGGNPNVVRRAPDGTVTLVAGSSSGGTGDGVAATTARFTGDLRLHLAGALLYVSDRGDNRVRVIDLGTGLITTVAGDRTAASGGDYGAGTAAQVQGPAELALHAGHLYIAEQDGNSVRLVW